jgi:putative ABC transport system substrate-binding protein
MGWDFSEMGRMTAAIAVRIKNGEVSDEIPVVAMRRLLLYINPAAAAREGVELSAPVLRRADEVITTQPFSESPAENR